MAKAKKMKRVTRPRSALGNLRSLAKLGKPATIRSLKRELDETLEKYRGERRENQVLRLQNGALMDVLRAHTEQVDGLLTQLVQTNSVMRARAKQHQAEGLLRSISDGAAGKTDINDD